MNAIEPRRMDVLEGVSQEVLSSQEREGVLNDIACGDVDRAASKVLQGLDVQVMTHSIDCERARTLYVLLGVGSSRFEQAQGLVWS